MSANVVFKISGGKTTFLVSEHTKAFMNKTAVVKRASHVVPLHLGSRIWFKVLRAVFGEYGKVSEWTRNWDCLWIVDLSPVGEYGWNGCFANRQDAIDWEIQYLNKTLLGV